MQRLPKLVIFGPQRSFPDRGDLSRLRLVVLSEPRLVAAIKDLPTLWDALLEVLPEVTQVPGPQAFQELKAWIDHGRPLTLSHPCPNVLSTPLSVIADTASYLHNLRVSSSDQSKGHAATLQSVHKYGGFQGLCTGILAAIAVSCSKAVPEIGDCAGVAVRLAVCVGAIVDLEGAFAVPANEACCLSVRSKSAEKLAALKILQDFPEAYVSVVGGDTQSTITVSKAAAPILRKHLASLDLAVKVIELEGRFHTPRHEKALKTILGVCNQFPGLKFSHVDDQAAHAFAPLGIERPMINELHEFALRSILTERADWHATLAIATAHLRNESTDLLAIGEANFLTHTTLKDINTCLNISYLQAFEFHERPELNAVRPESTVLRKKPKNEEVERTVPVNDIAIIGMACCFPGANSLEEYWQLLCEGRSMHREVPSTRFPAQELGQREGSRQTYWGNFLDDVEDFDHHFFNISPREAKSMDPQQRIALQVAYEAVEASGYFDELPSTKSVGCYLGIGSVDYQDNAASHPPTAFSALGTLRAFITGKISHYFGWTGPSITYDTACSSSAVAIHAACKAIQSGECSMALAGGVNIITSPKLYQYLSKAGFLSPSGPCKPFDADADGYCRGEGAGMLALKGLSTAIADGDSIAAVIAGSAVSQGDNSSPITVPHSQSQSDLYRKVTSMAGIDPSEVGYVEAHGTGTPVGDPIECDSIRQVFGDEQRRDTLYLGSVKSNIGHTEAASGVAAVIKAVLMMQKGILPVQANFNKLNPKISSLEQASMSIPMKTRRWEGSAVCVNNYGAAGSNAAMIIRRFPAHQAPQEDHPRVTASFKKYPIILTAQSASSLRAYCVALLHFLAERNKKDHRSGHLANMAFELAHRANQTLSTSVVACPSSLAELEAMLLNHSESGKTQLLVGSPRRPTVLCFGGQTKAWIGLSEEVYQSILIFRMHLDRCDSICRSLRIEGFYPKIFSKSPVEDIVLLQCMLFSVQYACAQSWTDCGLQVDVVIGHSIGQLTALCVSGSLSLQQAMELISGRARLIEHLWGPEKGTMLNIESGCENVREVLSLANQHGAHSVEVACFNGPSTVTFVGSEAAIEALESEIRESIISIGTVKVRRLDVTHGFHSHFVDPILPGLAELTRSIDFHEPQIQVQTCSEGRSWRQIDAEAVTQHSREPVYFSEAVNRIAKERGPCDWIEAGTDSGITTMARRALDISVKAGHRFQPISLTSESSMESLADATASLWQSGVKVQFWPYHRFQRHEYGKLPLPSYQFDKHRHWLEYEVPAATRLTGNHDCSRTPNLLSFVSFVRPQNSTQSLAVFMIDPESQDFKTFVQGHKVLGNGLCPASVYIHLTAKALVELIEKQDSKMADRMFCVEQLEMQSPLGLDTQRMISLSLESSDHAPGIWSFRICSYDSIDTLKPAHHASGAAYLKQAESPVTILKDVHTDHARTQDGEQTSINGSFIYNVFSTVVEYADYFKGMQKVSSRGTEVTGLVSLPQTLSEPYQDSANAISDPLMIDNVLQVAGLYINCLRARKAGTVFVCTQIQNFQHHATPKKQQLGPWSILCRIVHTSVKTITYDITAYDAQSQSTVVIILGARFTEVSAAALTKTFSKLGSHRGSSSVNNNPIHLQDGQNGMLHTQPVQHVHAMDLEPDCGHEAVGRVAEQRILEEPGCQGSGLRGPEEENLCFVQLRKLLSSVTGVPVADMHRNSLLEKIGIDSLMTTEVFCEIEKAFNVGITMTGFEEIKDLGSLASYVESKDPQKFYAVVTRPDPAVKSNGMTKLQGSPPRENSDDSKAADGDFISHERTGNSEGATTMKARESTSFDTEVPFLKILDCFEAARGEFTRIADETQLDGFTKHVFPRQAELVIAYVVEAFENLGCFLSQLKEGDTVSVPFIPQHTALMGQLHLILQSASLIYHHESGNVRSASPIKQISAHDILQSLLFDFPQHASEHRLLGLMAPHLAEFLSGEVDPIQLLFGEKATKDLLTDVYTNAPMFASATRLLASFLSKSIVIKSPLKPVRVFEVGGGVGGTTASIVELLEASRHPFIYTFTDISSSLVAAAKKRFTGHDSMDFRVLDIEAEPPDALLRSQDIIVATNVIHATKNLKGSCMNIRKMLDKDGMLCLVELTRNLHWFDLVFGLLDGWWRFEDSRKHAIADAKTWKRALDEAGFEKVVWTGDESEEGDLLRLIIAIAPNEAQNAASYKNERAQPTMETMLFKVVDRIPLYADIYYPREIQKTKSKRPIALLIHGGGHVMLSRKDIRPLQLQHLLSSGLLAISVDHRLCPELSLISGPMNDLCHALDWARNILPTMALRRPDIAADGTKVAVIGWSTGGMLAMSLGWTAPARGLKPPDVVLAFYSPTDYESEWWKNPHFPWRTSQADADQKYDLWDAVRETPITGYNIASARAPGGWMSTLDARARVPLHMNWTAQTLPILLGAMTSEKKACRRASSLEESAQQTFHDGHGLFALPSDTDVRTISPLAQIRAGNYRTPTYLIHGSEDEFIPWEETQRTYDELVKRGVPAGVSIVEGGGHMFEILGVPKDNKRVWQSVLSGYMFVFKRLGLA